MVDSRAKGARTEITIRDILRKNTGLQWERVPGSGSLDEKHGLKGDLYIPNERNIFCVEAKGYAEDHLTSAILTSKNPQLLQFWEQAVRQGKQVDKIPLLCFKHDRSKVFVAMPTDIAVSNKNYPYMIVGRKYDIFICLLEDWLRHDIPEFTY